MKEFALFPTPIGVCGIAWGPEGIVGTSLPGRTDADTEHALLAGTSAMRRPPSCEGAEAIRRITGLLSGHDDDLASVRLDWRQASGLEARVYVATRLIAPGRTSTYGDIAAGLGDALLARSVGQALGRNPWPIIVPCHRVLAAGGKSGGFSAPGGVSTKRRMLAIESVHAAREGDLFSA